MSSPYVQDDTLVNNPLLNGSYEVPDCALGVDVTTGGITAAGFLGIMGSLVDLGTSGAGTMSIQAFTFGQVAVPGNPRNFLRLAWTTGATAGTPKFCHKIEDVRTFSGQTVTLQGHYRSNAAIGIKLRQDFGTGGSPTSDVSTAPNGPINSIPSTVDDAGTAQWRPFTLTYKLPAITGLTLGSTANTSYIGVDFLPLLNTIFQADFSRLKLVPAGERSPMIQHRSYGDEEKALGRYYQKFIPTVQSGGTVLSMPFGPMRATPTVSGVAGTPFSGTNTASMLFGTNSGSTVAFTGNITLDARIAD